MFIQGHSTTGGAYLVICDGIGQLLDRSSQDLGILSIAQESNKCVLFGEWFKLGNDPLKPPERG